MKYKIIILLFAVCQAITTEGQKKAPKWEENVDKAIFTVETTTKEGMTKTGPGFLIKENGEAVASYELFRHADKAVAVTSTGERLPVTHILGADNLYGVIRFKVTVPKKTNFLPVAKVPPAMNATVLLPPSGEEKEMTKGTVSQITKVNSAYDYYQIDMALPQSQAGYPLLTETGEVFALAQADASGKGKTYGISVAYIQSLQTSTTDMFNKTYAEIGIRKAFSPDIDDAQISLMLYSSQQDAPTYLETLTDFIATFPNHPDGYINRATHYAYRRKQLASTESEQQLCLDNAWNDLESAAKYAKNKGEGYYNKAKVVFSIVAADSSLSHKNWNMKTAEDNLRKAISETNRPLYRHLEGDIAFFQNNFEKAYVSYSIVNKSAEASGASFYFAAKCKQQLGVSDLLEITSLIDSAVAVAPPNDAMEYLLDNIELKTQLGLYDLVIKDYDKYLALSGGNVSDAFYYYREQAKFRTGDLNGAMKDIEMAILLDASNALYYAEKASVCLRLNDIPKAKENAEKAITLEPDFGSAYRILGVCFLRQEKKQEACIHFNKAKEYGDPVVEKLIKENCSE